LTFHDYGATTNNTFSDSAYGFQHAVPGGAFTNWSDGVFANHSIARSDNTIENGFEARNLQSGMIEFADYSFEDGSWAPQGHGDLAEFFVDRHKGNFEITGGYLDLSPNYNPIDGYTANSDTRGPQFFTDYAGATPAIKNYTLFFTADRFLDDRRGAPSRRPILHHRRFQESVLARRRGRGRGATPFVWHSGRARMQRSDPLHLELYRLSLAIATDSLSRSTSTKFPSATKMARRRRSIRAIKGTVPGQRCAPVYDCDEPSLRPTLTLGLEYDGTYERAFSTGVLDSRWLRRISLGYNVSNESTFSVGLRDINGYGGFATQISARKPGRRCDAQSSHREVHLSCGRRRGDVAGAAREKSHGNRK
jgi:hypothetical protein